MLAYFSYFWGLWAESQNPQNMWWSRFGVCVAVIEGLRFAPDSVFASSSFAVVWKGFSKREYVKECWGWIGEYYSFQPQSISPALSSTIYPSILDKLREMLLTECQKYNLESTYCSKYVQSKSMLSIDARGKCQKRKAWSQSNDCAWTFSFTHSFTLPRSPSK